LLQECAIPPNALRILDCRNAQHPQRSATLRKRAPKAFLELWMPCLYPLRGIHVIWVCVLTHVLTQILSMPLLRWNFIGRMADWRKGWDSNPRLIVLSWNAIDFESDV